MLFHHVHVRNAIYFVLRASVREAQSNAFFCSEHASHLETDLLKMSISWILAKHIHKHDHDCRFLDIRLAKNGYLSI